MANTTGVFDVETSTAGVSIVATRDRITNAALSDAEVDVQVALAKTDLDAAANQAKAVIRKWARAVPDANRT